MSTPDSGSATGTDAPSVASATRRDGSDGGASVRRRHTARCAVLLVGLAFATVIQNWSDNQSSHYDLIRALDAGRTTIDVGPYPTKDKAYYRGHWYSARAPGLAIYSLPFYEVIHALDAPALARSSKALRGEDEMIYFVGLWCSVLPGLVMLLLVWRVADRFEPGYGGPAAVVLGQRPGPVPGPGLEGGDELALVDQADLEREQSEEEVAIRGGHDMPPTCGGGSDVGPGP